MQMGDAMYALYCSTRGFLFAQIGLVFLCVWENFKKCRFIVDRSKWGGGGVKGGGGYNIIRRNTLLEGRNPP